MPVDTDISATALAIALVALVVAVGQILQQYYATAEGARRCQSSVIGPWHRETKWHFRWSELRFEILFKSPHIVIAKGLEEDLSTLSELRLPSQGQSSLPIIGRFLPKKETGPFFEYLSKKSTEDELTEDQRRKFGTDQLVCWVPFLEELYKLERGYVDCASQIVRGGLHTPQSDDTTGFSEKRSIVQTLWRPKGLTSLKVRDSSPKEVDEYAPRYPALGIVRRSWDLVPPDIVRPYASSNLGDALAICHRLGMTLREINLSQGIIRAEGQGYSFSSNQVRGLGMLAYFTRDKAVAEKRDLRKLWAPSPTADSFAFGICPCDDGLEIPDLDISTDAKIFELLRQWDHMKGKPYFKQHQKEAERRGIFGRVTYGFTIVPGAMAPYLPSSNVPVFRAPHPQPSLWHQWSSPEEWHTFSNRLGDFLAKEGSDGSSYKQLRWIKEEIEKQDVHEAAPDSGIRTTVKCACKNCSEVGRSCYGDFMRRQRFKALHAETRTYIKKFNEMKLGKPSQEPSSNYFELLKSFVCVSIHRREEGEKRLKDQGGKPTNAYGMSWGLSPIWTEMGHLHWDKLAELERHMRTKDFGKDPHGEDMPIREHIVEAWATMYFRHLLFHRTSFLNTQGTFRPEFRNSNIPVYIG